MEQIQESCSAVGIKRGIGMVKACFAHAKNRVNLS